MKTFIVLFALLVALSACTNVEKERCQARYDQIMADGYSLNPQDQARAPGEIMSFVSGECRKYLQ